MAKDRARLLRCCGSLRSSRAPAPLLVLLLRTLRERAMLTVIESARISAVVEEALEKLSFLASITPDVMAHRDELSQIVGDEITRIIQE